MRECMHRRICSGKCILNIFVHMQIIRPSHKYACKYKSPFGEEGDEQALE